MYVYLDTSQLFEISKLSSTSDENGLSSQNFFQIWNNTNAELCLSFVHLKEISQLDDSDSRLRRISLLKKFNNFHFSPFGWNSIIEFEITAQVLNALGLIEVSPEIWTKKKIWNKLDTKSLTSYIKSELHSLRKTRQLYKGVGDLADIFRPMKSYMPKKLQLKVKDLKEMGKDDINKIGKLFLKSNSEDLNKGSENILIEKIISNIKKTGSLKKGLLGLLGLQNLSNINNVLLDDLDSLAVFIKLRSGVIPKIFNTTNIPEEDIKKTVQNIEYEKCPGFFMRMVLYRALKHSNKNYEPSDWMDADHIVYAPYVDIFYADKRTYTFLHQEINNKHNREFLMSNIHRIKSLHDLKDELANFSKNK